MNDMAKQTKTKRGQWRIGVSLANALAVIALAGQLNACATNAPAPAPPSPPPSTGAEPVETDTLGGAVTVPPHLLRDPRPQAPDRYVVRKGDTLWDISAHFLASPWLWPEIWLVNPQIENPHLIYPGDVVSLRWINGKPVLQLERAGGVRRLQPLVRSEPLPQPIPAIPMDAVRSFIEHARFMDEALLQQAPYVLAAADGHLMASKGIDIFVRGLPDNAAAEWQMVRAGQRYYDPDSGEFLGRESVLVGVTRILRAGDPARMKIVSSLRETLPGDLLVPPLDEEYQPELLLNPAPVELEAKVVAGFEMATRVGQYQILALNRGSNDGLSPGTTFKAYAAPVSLVDNIRGRGERVSVAGEYRGIAVVFRVAEKVSYALAMRSEQAMQSGDILRSPLSAAAQ